MRMKKLITYLLVVITMIITGCSESFDDSKIWDKLDDHESRIAKLEELCKQMNTNISSLQAIVKALQNNDYVTGITPITKDGETIGYTITFTKSQSITIYHGIDGKDGQNGTDGKDGSTPIIGVKQDSDNIYYWTLNGEWLLDANGNKIKVQGTDGKNGQDGADGTTPLLKIENDYWYVSYDNGATWVQLGKATGKDGKDGTNGADGNNGVNGEDGKDGDSFFQSVDTSNSEYVVFTLANGTQIKLPTWYAFEQLRTQCNQMNTNISSLQTIVQALQTIDYLISCVPLMENGVQIGYTLTFAKTGSIVIYHGKNGKDGADATIPIIGAKTHTDNILYWTIDGEWLLDNKGNKIPVHGRDGMDGTDGTNGSNGEDGVTPQLKIEDSYWYVSYNSGQTWTKLGKAVGENGKDGEDGSNGTNGKDGTDGDAFFQNVTQDEDFIHLILSTGEQIDIPRHRPLSVTFTETEDIRVLASKTYSIGYTITGADDKTNIKALAQDGFRAVVKKADNATGTIEITTPATILPTEILVFVTDGKERTIMRSINFVEGVIVVSSKTFTIDYEGGTVEVPLSTNIDYTVKIPEADESWISLAETRAVMRDETLTFTVAQNTTLTARYSTIQLIDALGVTSETILITQKAGSARTVHVATAGTLEDLIGSNNKNVIEELTLTGKINTFDFEFIKTMSNLKFLDMSGLDNIIMSASCLANTKITTVLLPLGLTAIPNRAFYQAEITSIYIPEAVQTIGEYAFYQCKSLQGSLAIPDATTSIGNYCFQECSFNGTLTLGNGLKTVGEYAFSQCAKFTGDLIIPDSVTDLGQYAFNECSGFTGKLVIGEGVTAINKFTFFKCSNLAGGVTISTNATIIGEGAFAYCSQLTGNLTIPDKVTDIGYGAFWECSGFTGYLILGKSIVSIGRHAFTMDGGRKKVYDGTHYEGGKYVEDYEYYSYPLNLNFSRIYSKATSVPSIYYGETWYYTTTENDYLSIDLWDNIPGGSRRPISTGGTFIDERNGSLPSLTVPNGCKSKYESNTNWNKTFALFEETEFE